MFSHAIPYISTHDREGGLRDAAILPHEIKRCGNEVDKEDRGFISINIYKSIGQEGACFRPRAISCGLVG
jgi:hypothetical protein